MNTSNIESVPCIVETPAVIVSPAAEPACRGLRAVLVSNDIPLLWQLKLPGAKFWQGAERLHYLAYAYLRGRAYRRCEPTARPFAEVYGNSAADLPATLALLINHYGGCGVTEARVKEWLAVPEEEGRRHRRLQGEELARLRREAARAAWRKQYPRATAGAPRG